MPEYLYAIQAAVKCPPYCGLLKIGRTNNPRARLSTHQIGSPIPLLYAGIWSVRTRGIAVRLEAACHREFGDYHQQGEWYRTSISKIATFVALIAKEQGVAASSAFDGSIPPSPAHPPCFGVGATIFRGSSEYYRERALSAA